MKTTKLALTLLIGLIACAGTGLHANRKADTWMNKADLMEKRGYNSVEKGDYLSSWRSYNAAQQYYMAAFKLYWKDNNKEDATDALGKALGALSEMGHLSFARAAKEGGGPA